MQELVTGDPRFANLKGFGGLAETVRTPQGWIAAYTKLTSVSPVVDPAQQQQILAFLTFNVPSEPEILLELKAGTIDESQARIMRAFAARKTGAAGQPPAAGALPAPSVPPKNGTEGKFVLPPFLGE